MKTWIELVEIWCVGAWKAANRLKIRYISALKTTLKRKALVPFQDKELSSVSFLLSP